MPHGQANVKAKTQDLVERTLELLEDGRKKIKYYDSNEYVMIIGKAGTGEHISHKKKSAPPVFLLVYDGFCLVEEYRTCTITVYVTL